MSAEKQEENIDFLEDDDEFEEFERESRCTHFTPLLRSIS